jgi:hypothetical protein
MLIFQGWGSYCGCVDFSEIPLYMNNVDIVSAKILEFSSLTIEFSNKSNAGNLGVSSSFYRSWVAP